MARRAWIRCLPIRQLWLISALWTLGCVVGPGHPAVMVRRPVTKAVICRDPAARPVRFHNPGPGPVAIGRTLIGPGSTVLCVPRAVRHLVAMPVWPTVPGTPPVPVRSQDGRATLGHPIEIGVGSHGAATATLDTRSVVPLQDSDDAAPQLSPEPPLPRSDADRDAAGDDPASSEDVAVDDGVAAGPAPRAIAAEGRYRLVSVVDLAGAQTLGSSISDVLVELSEFRDHPTPVLVKFIPNGMFQDAWKATPQPVKNLITRAIDKIIVKVIFDNISAVDWVAERVGDVGKVSRGMALESELVLTSSGGGSVLTGSHVLQRVGLSLWGKTVWLPLPSSFQQLTQLDVHAAVVLPGEGHGANRAVLSLGRQRFAIPYGELVHDAIAERVFAPAGAGDLGGWLNHIVDCGAIPRSLPHVINRQLPSLQADCIAALNAFGALVEHKIRALQIDLVDLRAGTCDAEISDDGEITALSNGSWDTGVQVHGEDSEVKAPFLGQRIADR